MRTGRPRGSPNSRTYELLCAWCKEPSVSRSPKAKFCSCSCKEKARYARDKEKRLRAARDYRETHAEEVRERTRERRRIPENRDKRREQGRKSYLRHREARVRKALRYQKDHPEVVNATRHKRRATRNFRVSGSDFRRILNRFSGKCAYCGVLLALSNRKSSPEGLYWDHVVPLSRGGVNSEGNLVPACRRCNQSKGSKFITEWRKSLRQNGDSV